ncbi:MAG: methyltransferase domain-containing protein [Spirochaetia bacterium]
MAEKTRNPHILCVVNVAKDVGTGHIMRIMRLIEKLGKYAFIYPNHIQENSLGAITALQIPESRICHHPENEGPWDLIILDNYQTSTEEAIYWMHLGRVVSLDEGGSARQVIPYLIDSLPTLPTSGEPNEFDTGYLSLPRFSGERKNPPQKILVTFGGVDQAHLTEKVGLMLDSFSLPSNRWQVAKGAFFERTFAWPGVKILNAPNIQEILPEYDLVITHFGLTAFEAVASGANVVLFNPTAYHEKLSQIAGFPSLGIEEINKRTEQQFHQYLQGLPTNSSWKHHVVVNLEKDLSEKLLSLAGPAGGCPACPKEIARFGHVIFRNNQKSYVECPSCGIIYQEPFMQINIEYNEDYFLKDYEEQYGRTYLDDFNHICHISVPRVKRILRHLKTGEKNLLEVGCAYGAFLKVASDYGFNVRGMEINKESAEYVRTQLKLPVTQVNFPEDVTHGDSKFDVVALWYVLEHFKDLDTAMQKISELVKNAGIFAFSTPLGDGMTATLNPKKFYKESPSDHHTIFTRKNVKKILAKYGFKVVHIEVTGVHPERKNIKILPGKSLYRFYQWWYKKKKMGDTFEVYAVKKER